MPGSRAISPQRFNPTHLSIKWKVFVPVAGIVLAAFLGYAYIGLHAAETQLLDKTDRSAAVLAAAIARMLRPAMLHDDAAALNRLLDDLSGMPDLEGLHVLRPGGVPWAERIRTPKASDGTDAGSVHAGSEGARTTGTAGRAPAGRATGVTAWGDANSAGSSGAGAAATAAGRIRAGTARPIVIGPETAQLCREALQSPTGTAGRLSDAWIYRVVRVIRRSDQDPSAPPLGFLEMDLAFADTQRRIQAGRLQLALISLITLLAIAAALMIIIHALVSAPLNELAGAMSRVEAGDLKARAMIRSGDELEAIGHSFNRMVEEIENKNAQLVEAGQQLLRSEKLASIGLLAAGVAHEINNPVATISMSAEGLLETEASPERRRFLRAIVEESERIGAIVRNLLGFERGGHTAYARASLGRILFEAEADLRREAERAGVTVTMDLRMPHDAIQGQADQLRQAFVNIMDNALRAMDGGGRLDITARTDGGTAVIHFHDSGPGIPEEHQKRIFDPFFTTREVGEGFGLGLAACYEIIKRHDGDISVQSGPDGTTFTIELPLMDAPAKEGPAKEGPAKDGPAKDGAARDAPPGEEAPHGKTRTTGPAGR